MRNKNIQDINILIDNRVNSIHELTNRSKNHIIERGYYDEIIEHLYKFFSKEQVYISISEEFRNNKNKYNEIYDFLNVNKIDKIPENLDKHSRKYIIEKDYEIEKKIYNIYKQRIENLYSILGKRIKVWDDIHKKYN